MYGKKVMDNQELFLMLGVEYLRADVLIDISGELAPRSIARLRNFLERYVAYELNLYTFDTQTTFVGTTKREFAHVENAQLLNQIASSVVGIDGTDVAQAINHMATVHHDTQYTLLIVTDGFFSYHESEVPNYQHICWLLTPDGTSDMLPYFGHTCKEQATESEEEQAPKAPRFKYHAKVRVDWASHEKFCDSPEEAFDWVKEIQGNPPCKSRVVFDSVTVIDTHNKS